MLLLKQFLIAKTQTNVTDFQETISSLMNSAPRDAGL